MLDRIDRADQIIDELTEQIKYLLGLVKWAVHGPCGIPGVPTRTHGGPRNGTWY